MRIALISSVKRLPTGEQRAQKELAGRSVLAWQVDYALHEGCERVICLCDAPSSHIIEQQHRLERDGLGFHTVRSPLQILGLVKPDDQILMILDGLIPSDGVLDDEVSEKPPCIITIPSDHPLSHDQSEDFERIDRDRHWAGLALISGAAASGLEMMPSDGDAMSLLLRLGLQDRTPLKPLPIEDVDDGHWLLASDPVRIEKRFETLISANLPPAHWSGPAGWLAVKIVRASASFWLKSGSLIAAGLALALMAFAGAISAFGFAIAGLAVAVLAALIGNLSSVADSLKSAVSGLTQRHLAVRLFRPAMTSLGTIVLIFALAGQFDWPTQVAIPALTTGLISLAGKDLHAPLWAFWRDRSLQFGLFLLAALFGSLNEFLLVFALAALLQLMLRTTLKSDSV